ncbi:MAG: hypothetical protein ACOZIN_22515 [Myxococcota bacterium]
MDAAARSFSPAWTVLSVFLFLAVELVIGVWVGPMVVGRYVSPMFHLQLQMIMHLASFYLGGVLVGLLSPGVRLKEPAVGAAISVVVVFLFSFFMPTWFYLVSPGRMAIGALIAMGLAVGGAYSGERLMGNIDANGEDARRTARGRLRSRLWNESSGLFIQRAPPPESKLFRE